MRPRGGRVVALGLARRARDRRREVGEIDELVGLPPIITGLQIAFPICLIVSIVAEMATGEQGLGGYMMYHQNLGSSDKMYLGIFCAGVIGYLLIEGFAWLRRKLLAWHTETIMTV